MYGLFHFEYTSHGVLLENLICAAEDNAALIDRGLKYGPLVKTPRKEIATFRKGGVYSGRFIRKIKVVK